MLKQILTRARDAASGSPAVYLAPVLLLLAIGFWLTRPDPNAPLSPDSPIAGQHQPAPRFWATGGENALPPEGQPPNGFDGPDDRPPRDGRNGPPGDRGRDGGRHHGPPPCGLPPTVIFLIGGALGFLLGSRKRGCCGHHHGPHHCGHPPAPPAPPTAG